MSKELDWYKQQLRAIKATVSPTFHSGTGLLQDKDGNRCINGEIMFRTGVPRDLTVRGTPYPYNNELRVTSSEFMGYSWITAVEHWGFGRFANMWDLQFGLPKDLAKAIDFVADENNKGTPWHQTIDIVAPEEAHAEPTRGLPGTDDLHTSDPVVREEAEVGELVATG